MNMVTNTEQTTTHEGLKTLPCRLLLGWGDD